MEAFYGFLGVLVGAFIPWVQSAIASKLERKRHAAYLAIRVVITLRQYLYKCWLVSVDDGLTLGQRDIDGCLEPQAQDPGPIKYPEDIDWKSIDSKLAYALLSLQLQAESADRAISAAIEFTSGPPDYEEVFEERHLQYSMIGLKVLDLEKEICRIYKIPSENSLENWNPHESFHDALRAIETHQAQKAEASQKLRSDLTKFSKETK